jgi:hypothetical protein
MAVSGSFPIFLRRPSLTLRPDKGAGLVGGSLKALSPVGLISGVHGSEPTTARHRFRVEREA